MVKNKNYSVTCLDNFWFGDKVSKKVTKIKRDIRNLKDSDLKNFHTVIHLAYLSNDPLCELNGRDNTGNVDLLLYTLYLRVVKKILLNILFLLHQVVCMELKEKKK